MKKQPQSGSKLAKLFIIAALFSTGQSEAAFTQVSEGIVRIELKK